MRDSRAATTTAPIRYRSLVPVYSFDAQALVHGDVKRNRDTAIPADPMKQRWMTSSYHDRKRCRLRIRPSKKLISSLSQVLTPSGDGEGACRPSSAPSIR